VIGQEYSIGGDPVPGDRAVKFDGNGVSDELEMIYTDAGKVKVEATLSLPKAGDNPAVVLKGSAEFVSRPFGLCLETDPDLKHDSSKRFARAAGGETVHVAGKEFELRVRAVTWTPADEADPDASAPRQPRICENPSTPNYEQAGISLTHAVLEPDPPASIGDLTIKSYEHQRGESTVVKGQKIFEVGIFQLIAEPPPYFGHGMAHAVSLSDRIGRFIPAWLEVSGVASLDSCDKFSYQRELVPYDVFPKLTITGKNLQGATTKNYDRGDFWRLSSALSSTWWTLDGERELTAKLSFPGQDSALNDAEDRDGQREYEWSGGGLKYDSASPTPGADDLPFSILQRFSAAVLTDADGACYRKDGGVTCLGYDLEIEDSEIRLGRLSIANGHGSELQPLSLPWVIESWQAPGVFLPEPKDSCSASNWGQAEASDQKGELAGKQLTISGGQTGHKGDLVIEKPEATGTARIGFPYVPEWLEYDWRGEGREASRGLATFGIYQGPKPLIFRREVYR